MTTFEVRMNGRRGLVATPRHKAPATLPALGRTDPCRDQPSFQGRSGPAKLFPDRALPVRRSTVLDRDRSELREAGADKSG